MGFLSTIKEKMKTEEVAKAPEQEKYEIEPIPVKDIKAILVNEFERAKKLEARIEEYEEVIEELRITEQKYKASQVTLQEYQERVKSRENKIDSLQGTIQEKNNEISSLNDDINTIRIKVHQQDSMKEGIQKEVREQMADSLVRKTDEHKGIVSKATIREWVSNEV